MADRRLLVFFMLFATATAWLVFTLYPGMMYSDSFPRWELSQAMVEHGLRFDFRQLGMSDYYPVVPAIFMAGFYSLTYEVGFFILCQALAFLVVSFGLLKALLDGSRSGAWIAAFVTGAYVLMPHSWMYAVFHSFDSVATVALAALAWALVSGQRGWLVVSLFFVLVSFRLTAAALLPVVLWHLLRRSEVPLRRGVHLLALAAALFVPFKAGSLFQLERRDVMAVGLAWELVGMMRAADPSRYATALDFTGSSTADAMADVCPHGIWCGSETELAMAAGQSPEIGGLTKAAYWNFVREQPLAFVRYKITVAASILGLSKPLYDGEIGRRDKVRDMRRFGFVWNDRQESLIHTYKSWMGLAGPFLLRPWLVFLIAFGLGAALWLARRDGRPLLLVGLATVFYASFFVTSQNHELRYFYPSLHLLALSSLASAASLASLAVDRVRQTGARHSSTWKGVLTHGISQDEGIR